MSSVDMNAIRKEQEETRLEAQTWASNNEENPIAKLIRALNKIVVEDDNQWTQGYGRGVQGAIYLTYALLIQGDGIKDYYVEK